jgi:hypothetical protein
MARGSNGLKSTLISRRTRGAETSVRIALAALGILSLSGACNQAPPPEDSPGIEDFVRNPAQIAVRRNGNGLTLVERDGRLYAEVIRQDGVSVCGDPSITLVAVSGPVSINEVKTGGMRDEKEDWIELFNTDDEPVLIEGWTLSDHYSNGARKTVPGSYVFAEGWVVCPERFAVVERTRGCADDKNEFDFGLGSDDELTLADASGELTSRAWWRNAPRDQSMGRPDDEDDEFVRLKKPTKEAANTNQCYCCGECREGRCSLVDGQCVATDEQECRKSDACEVRGLCMFLGAACVAGADADCEGSNLCEDKGRCSVKDGVCLALTDEGCAQATVCEEEGRCVAIDGACQPSKDEHCANSMKCAENNRCYFEDGRCVARECESAPVCTDPTTSCCFLVDGKCVALDS